MDDDGIADAHVLAGKLVVVVQGRTRDDRAIDGGRVEFRDGREHTCTPHLHGDVAQNGRLFLGRKLEGNGPARCLGGKPELGLDGEVVDLHDDAIDVVIEIATMLQRVLAELVHRGLAIDHADVGIDRETGRAQPFQKLMLARDAELRGLSDGVNERGQITLCRNRRVLLAKRTGRSVTAIGEALLERELAPRALTGVNFSVVEHDLVVLETDGIVKALEGGTGHVHLAAHLDGLGEAHGATLYGEMAGYVLDLQDVCRDVLAHAAIATGGGPHECAAIVGECDGGAIDLELAAIREAMAHRLAGAGKPFVELVEIHRIVERVHAVLVLCGGKLFSHATADGLRR